MILLARCKQECRGASWKEKPICFSKWISEFIQTLKREYVENVELYKWGIMQGNSGEQKDSSASGENNKLVLLRATKMYHDTWYNIW